MTDQFVALDVETANSARGSICQIGLAVFDHGAPVWEWSSFVNPECDFDDRNVRLHGIGSSDVRTAPAWPSVLGTIYEKLEGQVVASHSQFDYQAIHASTQRYGLALPACRWLDTHALARTAWPDLDKYDLQSLCQTLGIELTHHEAASDARACGELMLRGIAATGSAIAQWTTESGRSAATWRRARGERYSERIEADGNPHGPLAGHVWVCTGDFSMGERALVELAASLGCNVRESVTKKTTMLILGQRDPAQYGGKVKSHKQLKAEAEIAAGRNVTIMTEQEFIELAARHRDGQRSHIRPGSEG